MRRRERVLRNFRDACKHRSVPMQLLDLITHKLKINTHWEDYYRFGFYRQDKSWAERALYLSDSGSRYWPWEGNSLKFDAMFIRKSLQKSVAIAHDLPTTPFLMKVGKYYPINSKEKFAAELAKISVPMILKIDGGMRGAGIHLIEPDSGKYLHKGELVTVDWIWDRFKKNLDPGFIIEEKAQNHPVLDEVHPESFNTLRLSTIRTADGQLHLARPFIKFGRGGTHVDNLNAGGVFAIVDENHRLGTAFDATGEAFENHPDTGVQISGLEVPFFEQAVELAFDASRVFGFMATIGWDIGITPDGPVLVEGNSRWGANDVQDFTGPFLTQEIADGLMPRSWWTPWDKTHLYPYHMQRANGGWWQKSLAKRRRNLTALPTLKPVRN
ncbi:MAG: sugar-transfer associated ATP-grasp domain-containing protein [Woeseiaceae bacterium]